MATVSYQSKVKNRQIEINFTGGNISSDGGVLLLRELQTSGFFIALYKTYTMSKKNGKLC
ncbi:MAG: transposase [Rickettsia endosymbiont of Labidopullus appendiculatus]|nr:transposase [Rickettsia endosymbiont of Labidopullus appendiculatus]